MDIDSNVQVLFITDKLLLYMDYGVLYKLDILNKNIKKKLIIACMQAPI